MLSQAVFTIYEEDGEFKCSCWYPGGMGIPRRLVIGTYPMAMDGAEGKELMNLIDGLEKVQDALGASHHRMVSKLLAEVFLKGWKAARGV